MSAALDLSLAEMAPVAGGYDYSQMPAATAAVAREAASNFRTVHRRITREVVKVGESLIQVKEKLEHGQFEAWLDAEFGHSTARTARNYMLLARNLGDKTEIISGLPLTVAYKLAAPSVPDDLRAAVVRHMEEEPQATTTTVVQMIDEGLEARKQRLEAEREEARRAKLTEEQRKDEDRKGKSREQSRKRREAENLRREEEWKREREEQTLAVVRFAVIIAECAGSQKEELLSAISAIDGYRGVMAEILLALGRRNPDRAHIDQPLINVLASVEAERAEGASARRLAALQDAYRAASHTELQAFGRWVQEQERQR